MTYTLTTLFLNKRFEDLDMPDGDTTQQRKHQARVDQYLEQTPEKMGVLDEGDSAIKVTHYDSHRAFYNKLSKITKQVWRFLKECFHVKSSLPLYQRQLKPLLEKYL